MRRNTNFGVYDESDMGFVPIRGRQIGYVNKYESSPLVAKVSPKNLELCKKLLTPRAVKVLCMKKKVVKKTIISVTRL